jgi:uncharacterized protein YqeY
VTENTIKQAVMEAMKRAMKEQQKDRLNAIRLIQAAFKQKEVDERIEITDNVALVIFDKMIKQRKDSIEQYKKANRDDLVQKEVFELDVIREFMPAALTSEELKQLVVKTIVETNAKTIKDMARIMSVLKPLVQGRADMTEISNLIKASLAE